MSIKAFLIDKKCQLGEILYIDIMNRIEVILDRDTYRNVLSMLKMAEAKKIFLGNHRVFISALIYLEAKKNGNKITKIDVKCNWY
jgi:hypothetical protein